MPLTHELELARTEIEAKARQLGLDFFPTDFALVDWQKLNEIAAYGGFPNRYPHWRFGMSYWQLIKSHAYGASRIYELVINNDPCHAFLLEGNPLTTNKLVIAHVSPICPATTGPR